MLKIHHSRVGELLKIFFVWIAFLGISLNPVQADDWKGEPEATDVTVGGLVGMGIVNYTLGFAVTGTISKKIIKRGFIPDINDSVSIEGMVGPTFLPGATAWLYSAHLRWDFVKDNDWTLYALGGAGGNIVSSQFRLLPRFGVGAFWKMKSVFSWRGEISHDLIALGVNFAF